MILRARGLAISFAVLLLALAVPVAADAATTVVAPTEGFFERQQVKTFGTLVTREFHEQRRQLFPTGGLPNQFTGYHAAVDLEFHDPASLNREIPVVAVAAGEVIFRGSVPGYGGLIALRHAQPESVTSLYGHVRLADAPVRVGQEVTAGQTLAFLGANFSADTSGARKHLHFGIHKGPSLVVAGHVPTQAALAAWHDPNEWLRRYLPQPTPLPSATVVPQPSPLPEPKGFWDRLFGFFANLFG